jgi:hypothetical protein
MHRDRGVRALGEPTGGRRLTGEQNTEQEATEERDVGDALEQPVRQGRPGPSQDRGDDAPADRTTPFPYAESFGEWVSDETAEPEGRRDRREEGAPDG